MTGDCDVCRAGWFSSRQWQLLGYLVQEQGQSARQGVFEPHSSMTEPI